MGAGFFVGGFSLSVFRENPASGEKCNKKVNFFCGIPNQHNTLTQRQIGMALGRLLQNYFHKSKKSCDSSISKSAVLTLML
jgi:hypothetical protein